VRRWLVTSGSTLAVALFSVGVVDGGRPALAEPACVDLSSNAEHCGRRGHSCLGAACVDGVCEPLTLAEGNFESIALSGSSLYVVGDDVSRLSTSGGALEPIAEAVPGLWRIAADANYLYGAIFQRPEVTEYWRIPLSGGGFDAEGGGFLLGTARSSTRLIVGDDFLVTLEAQPTERIMTQDIVRFDLAGAGAATVGTNAPSGPDALAMDDDYIYTLRGDPELGGSSIVRVPIAGGDFETILEGAPGEAILDIALGGRGDLAFVSSQRVGRVPVAGGPGVDLVAEGADRIIADSRFIYYFQRIGSNCDEGMDVFRIPFRGGQPQQLAREAPLPPEATVVTCVSDVLADNHALYWLTADGAMIRKASKR
jgi:hypothetical protein